MERVEVKRLENESFVDWWKRSRLSYNLKCNYCGKDASDNERNYIPDAYCPNVVCKEHDYMAFSGRINKVV